VAVATASALRAALLELIPDETRVSVGDSVLDLHSADFSLHPPRRPDVVVYPTATEEVRRVLAFANDRRVPVVPFGAGTNVEGQVIPVAGGICLDLTRLDRILDVRPADLTATAQAGVTRKQLNRAAGEHGLFFPVDPGADATLGGMAATNAAGTTTIRYGKMRAQVLALEAVLADGRVVRAGTRAVKTSAGYDLVSLLVGSEGTLGVVTELTVRLYGIPEAAVAARAVFPTVDAACRAAAAIVAAGVPVDRLELVDELTMRCINAFKGTSYPERPTLFLEAAGSAAAVEADLDLVRALALAEGCDDVELERDQTRRVRLWEARHDAAHAITASAPGKKPKATDVCVPVSELPAAIATARSAAERLGLDAPIAGHVGDGNYHVALMVDPDDADELRRAAEFDEAIVTDALARGGTCTGEHGIGLGKQQYLQREHGDLLPLFRGMKDLFDPNGILNPGKVLPPADA
jgi:D-lactate dehydrogenase (cytochrome)